MGEDGEPVKPEQAQYAVESLHKMLIGAPRIG
jgi:hypothetical protein